MAWAWHVRSWQGQLQWESSPARVFQSLAGEFYGAGGGETGQRSNCLHHFPGSSHHLPGPLGPHPQTAKTIVLPSWRGGGEVISSGESCQVCRSLGPGIHSARYGLDTLSHQVIKTTSVLFTTHNGEERPSCTVAGRLSVK